MSFFYWEIWTHMLSQEITVLSQEITLNKNG